MYLHPFCSLFRKKLNQRVKSWCILHSVAEPPLFWVAPAPEVRGPGADSGSDQLGLAPAPGRKGGSRQLRLHTQTFFILSS